MSMNDPLANVLSHMFNCEKIGKDTAYIRPSSRLINEVLRILNEKGYIGEFREIDDGKGKVIKVSLLGMINQCGVVKPRYAVKSTNYEKYEKRFLPAAGLGLLIVSTNKGMMTHESAKQQNAGGKLIAYCY